jgi:hypothetical protein
MGPCSNSHKKQETPTQATTTNHQSPRTTITRTLVARERRHRVGAVLRVRLDAVAADADGRDAARLVLPDQAGDGVFLLCFGGCGWVLGVCFLLPPERNYKVAKTTFSPTTATKTTTQQTQTRTANAPCKCTTNGQWLQINITSVAFLPAATSASATCLPVNGSSSENSGARVPMGRSHDSVSTLFYGCGVVLSGTLEQ